MIVCDGIDMNSTLLISKRRKATRIQKTSSSYSLQQLGECSFNSTKFELLMLYHGYCAEGSQIQLHGLLFTCFIFTP